MGIAHAAITILFTPLGGTQVSLSSALGTAVAFIETKALNIGDDTLTYYIDKINSHITNARAQTKLRLEIYGAEAENGPFILFDSIDLSLEDPGFTDPPGARYYKFRFIDTGVMERWQLHGFDVHGEPGGDEF